MTPVDRPGPRARALVVVAVVLLLAAVDLVPAARLALARADALLWDQALRLAGPRPPPADLVVVAVDDDDLAAMGGWPLDRGRWAELIARLDAAGARTVVLDVLLERRSDGDRGTAALAAAMARHGNVLLPLGVAPAAGGVGPADGLAARLAYDLVAGAVPAAGAHRLVAPAPTLVAAAAALGPSAVEVDAGTRPPVLRAGLAVRDRVVPALAVEAVRRHRGEPRSALWLDPARGAVLAGAALAPARDARYRLAPYGPPGTIPTLPARRLEAGSVELDGALVVVGVSAVAAGERFRTAFTPALSGTELLATGIGNLLEGRTLRAVPPASGLALGLAAATAAVAAWALGRRRAPVSLATGAALALLLAAAVQAVLVHADWWLPLAPMSAALVGGVIGTEAVRLVLVQRAERAFADAQRKLARFFPPHVADRLAAEPDVRGLDQAVEATIMFVDVVDSSALVERLTPPAAMAELRRFAVKVEDAVFAEDGTLVAFMGDGAFAAFGVPDGRADAPAAGLRCARRLVAAFAEDELAIAVGLHHGEVIVGIGGGERQFQFTVMGDTVHLASRLEGLTRELGAAIVVSAAVAGRIDDPLLLAGFVRRAGVVLRGRAAPVDIAWLPRGQV